MKNQEFDEIVKESGLNDVIKQLTNKHERSKKIAAKLYNKIYKMNVIQNCGINEILRRDLLINLVNIDELTINNSCYTFEKFHHWLNDIENKYFKCAALGFHQDAKIIIELGRDLYKEIIMQAPIFEQAFDKWKSGIADSRAYRYGLSFFDVNTPLLEFILKNFSECERLRFYLGVLCFIKRRLKDKEEFHILCHDIKNRNIKKIIYLAFDNQSAFDNFEKTLNRYNVL